MQCQARATPFGHSKQGVQPRLGARKRLVREGVLSGCSRNRLLRSNVSRPPPPSQRVQRR